jgi:hypothetical protein
VIPKDTLNFEKDPPSMDVFAEEWRKRRESNGVAPQLVE